MTCYTSRHIEQGRILKETQDERNAHPHPPPTPGRLNKGGIPKTGLVSKLQVTSNFPIASSIFSTGKGRGH